MTADADTADRRAGRLALLTLLGIVVAVQVVVLYSPSSHGGLLFPQADKVVHVLVFLVPVAVALLAGLRPAAVVALFVAQAVVSEVVQGTLLPGRSGDVVDVVADLAGIALGIGVWHLVDERTRGGSSSPTSP